MFCKENGTLGIDYWGVQHGTAVVSPPSCPYCGMYHQATCPRIESIKYYENGTVKKVTFKKE